MSLIKCSVVLCSVMLLILMLCCGMLCVVFMLCDVAIWKESPFELDMQ